VPGNLTPCAFLLWVKGKIKEIKEIYENILDKLYYIVAFIIKISCGPGNELRESEASLPLNLMPEALVIAASFPSPLPAASFRVTRKLGPG